MKIISIITSLIICVSGYALTLGKIDVHSGLDQKLNASVNIDFLPDGKKIVWEVKADAMGRTINGLRYKLEKDGELTNLMIFTDQPIHFPVITLNILANVDDKQVAADEFTILLDPVSKPVPINVKKYGPISKGESLKEITNKVKPNYITVDNASNALFYANPHAFENNDPSRLIPGSFLILPEFSEGISAVGTNSISNAKIIKIEEQLGLIVSEVSDNNKISVKKYTELSEYALNLEKLVTTLASRMTSLESGTSFLVEDITKQAKVQQKAMSDISVQIQKNHELVVELQERSQLWFYVGIVFVVILGLIAAFIWWRKRKQQDEDEEEGLIDSTPDVLDDESEVQVEEEYDSENSEEISALKGNLSTNTATEMDLNQEDLENIDSGIVDKSDVDNDEPQIEINEKEIKESDDVEGYHNHFLEESNDDGIVFMSQDDDEMLKDTDLKVDIEMLSDEENDFAKNKSINQDDDFHQDLDKDINNAIIVNKSEDSDLLFDEQDVNSGGISENEYDISAEDNDESLTDLENELEMHSKLEVKALEESKNNDLDISTNIDDAEEKDIDKESKKKDGALSLTPLDLNGNKDK